MSACEKCWEDACRRELLQGGSKVAHYEALLDERIDSPCTPEQQAGRDAKPCPRCKRVSLHQHTNECMNPLCPEPA